MILNKIQTLAKHKFYLEKLWIKYWWLMKQLFPQPDSFSFMKCYWKWNFFLWLFIWLLKYFHLQRKSLFGFFYLWMWKTNKNNLKTQLNCIEKHFYDCFYCLPFLKNQIVKFRPQLFISPRKLISSQGKIKFYGLCN